MQVQNNTGFVWKVSKPECESSIHIVGPSKQYFIEELLKNKGIKKIFDLAERIFAFPYKDEPDLHDLLMNDRFLEKLTLHGQKYPEKIFIDLNKFVQKQIKTEELSKTAKRAYDAYFEKGAKKSPLADFVALSCIQRLSLIEKADTSQSTFFKTKQVEDLLTAEDVEKLHSIIIDIFSEIVTLPAFLGVLKSLWNPKAVEMYLEYADLHIASWQCGDYSTYSKHSLKFLKPAFESMYDDTIEKEVDYFSSQEIKKTLTLKEIIAFAEEHAIPYKEELESINILKEQNDNNIKMSFSGDQTQEIELLKQEKERLEKSTIRQQLISAINELLENEAVVDLECEPLTVNTPFSEILAVIEPRTVMSTKWLFLFSQALELKRNEDRLKMIPKCIKNCLKLEELWKSSLKQVEEWHLEEIASLQKLTEDRLNEVRQNKLTKLSFKTLLAKIDRLFEEKSSALIFDAASEECFVSLKEKGYVIEQVAIPMRAVGLCFEIVHKVTGNKGTLLGTIHACSEKVYNFNSHVWSLFERADLVAVELDVTRPDVLKKIQKHLLETSEAVKSFLELNENTQNELLEKLKTFFGEEGETSLPNAEQFIHYFLAYGKLILKKIGKKHGIDSALISKAREYNKSIVDLEIFDDHMKSLENSLPDASSIDTLKNLNEKTLEIFVLLFKHHWKENYKHLEKALERGYLDAFSLALRAQSQEEIEALNFRNMKIVMKISELMATDKFPFMMVGAAHFPGDMGLITLLEKSGYECNRVVVYEPSGL